MPTKRTPIVRHQRAKITPEALAAFRAMQRLERQCTCKGGDHDCPACAQRAEQHSILHRELRLEPWEWPVYGRPDDANPLQDGSDNPDPPATDAVARYQALVTASEAAKEKR
jgi:hypothetical protein